MSHPKEYRDYQVTVNLTKEEREAFLACKPADMSLAKFVRECALKDFKLQYEMCSECGCPGYNEIVAPEHKRHFFRCKELKRVSVPVYQEPVLSSAPIEAMKRGDW